MIPYLVQLVEHRTYRLCGINGDDTTEAFLTLDHFVEHGTHANVTVTEGNETQHLIIETWKLLGFLIEYNQAPGWEFKTVAEMGIFGG